MAEKIGEKAGGNKTEVVLSSEELAKIVMAPDKHLLTPGSAAQSAMSVGAIRGVTDTVTRTHTPITPGQKVGFKTLKTTKKRSWLDVAEGLEDWSESCPTPEGEKN